MSSAIHLAQMTKNRADELNSIFITDSDDHAAIDSATSQPVDLDCRSAIFGDLPTGTSLDFDEQIIQHIGSDGSVPFTRKNVIGSFANGKVYH